MKTEVFVSEPVAQALGLYDGLVGEEAWNRMASEQLDLLADRLMEGQRMRAPGAAVELHNWLPNAGGRSAPELFELGLSRGDAFETVARAHGFANSEHVRAAGQNRGNPVFEQAIEHLLAGDILALAQTLDRAPEMIDRRSHYGHRATLLHYLAANGVETYRQRVPLNAAAIATLLIQRGADVRATLNAYGKRLTTRSLLVSSGHPRAAGVTRDILAVLESAGGLD